MFGGQHRVDEGTQAEQVGVDRDQRSTTEKDPSSNKVSLRERTGVPNGENKRLKEGKKINKLLTQPASLEIRR
jgi:hypothetical protein